jgi:quercetin dioxygenase-like cupin family protein
MTINVVPPATGETISSGASTIRILESGDNTDHRLGLVEVTLEPGFTGPPQHIHREHDETFFILSGTPTFTSGTDVVVAQPGVLVTAPVDTPHTFANTTNQPVVMLCTVTPDRYIGYFRELGNLPKSPDGSLDPKAVGAIMARYATEVVRPGA